MKTARLVKGAWILGALLIITTAAIRGLRSSEPSPPEAPGDRAETGEPPLEPPLEAPSSDPTPPSSETRPAAALSSVPCELSTLVEEFRKAGRSPAYRGYLRAQLQSIAETLPADELWSLLAAEKEPEVLQLLGETWTRRYGASHDVRILEKLVAHLSSRKEPTLRAALVRAFRHTMQPSTELRGGAALKARHVYAAWVKDEAPEVRQAVVENVQEEAARNIGYSRDVAESAVTLSEQTSDPKVKAALLTASSLKDARPLAVTRVRGMLQKGEHPDVRAAAAIALGTVETLEQIQSNTQALVEQYATETDRQVRIAILESIARLGLGKAVPVLQRLREVDASLHGEVDRWLALLASNPQTWSLLEKDRRASETRAP
jgi:hypothetical protein